MPTVVLVGMLVSCFLLPVVLGIPNPNSGALASSFLPPFAPGHLFGTDQLGNDILSQCLYGGQVAIEVSVASVALGFLIGGGLGVLAGYFGGTVDSIVMRILDAFLAFPALVLALVIVTFLGESERNVIIAIAFFTVPSKARMARATTLRIRSRDFLLASRLMGKSDGYILRNHIIRNVAPPLMTFAMLNIAAVMVVQASLSYLGLGVPPPTPNWGWLIAEGQGFLASYPWIAFIPSAFLFVTVLALNALGDALRVRLKA